MLFPPRAFRPQPNLHVSWNPPQCNQRLEEIAVIEPRIDLKPGQQIFDDTSLQKLLNEKKDGVIYAFSPNMHLSVEDMPEIKKAAEKLDLKLDVVMDATGKATKKQAETYPVLMAKELEFRGMNLHFPCIIVYSKTGKISGIYPGRKTAADYENYIHEFLK